MTPQTAAKLHPPDAPDLDPTDINPAFADQVLEGLSAHPKHIPCTWFYDRRGSELFEQITELNEYYLTRSETALLRGLRAELSRLPAGAAVIEFGSGSSRKTPLLLDALNAPASYTAIDISGDFLRQSVRALQLRFPRLAVHALEADFTAPLRWPAALEADVREQPRIGFFPGSTIGNFTPEQAVRFLHGAALFLGPGAHLLVGVDGTQDKAKLIPAYDDARGVTAAFNRNLLTRINRELGADFNPQAFRHVARFDAAHSRIEMHLLSPAPQTVRLLGQRFTFAEGETLHTENSYKYPVAMFQRLAHAAGWTPHQHWLAADAEVALHWLRR
ncbi:MAG: L-histidine N(alpha)-methyltransferase [Thiomonas sp.]|uniref:L-histidine N(alpha)-methyltransferase n=1 Tax=Thiomonas sp. TaxID=2047785 RepID=UPI002A36B9F4|nr:L-histidine N(alpha)-methyltransferase [Thiomonas sp.]MDY0329551.1 L-histidine N(alpha)-methyltransferase [Thiomonas sp.]